MTVYNQQNPNEQEEIYDLGAEKKRIAEGTEEIKKELLEKWQKRYADAPIFPDTLKQISPAVIDFLLSFENTLFYNQLAEKFKLDEKQRDILPQIVWQLSLDKNWDELENSIASAMKIPQAKELVQDINDSIILKIKAMSEERPSLFKKFKEQVTQASIENLSLAVAIKKYPEVSEQLVTSSRIKIRSFSEPARPSIKNWLSDYTFTMGFDSHDASARGVYIFRNENAKNLSPADKDKLNYILKSFDTNEPVVINMTLKQIIFPSVVPGATEQISTPPVEKRNMEQPKDIFQKADLARAKRNSDSKEIIMPKKTSASGKKPPVAGYYGTFTLSRKTAGGEENENEKSEAKKTILPSARKIFQRGSGGVATTPSNLSVSSDAKATPGSKIEFTSPQKLPFEKQNIQTGQLQRPEVELRDKKAEPMPIKIIPTNLRQNTTSNNVVDLKK